MSICKGAKTARELGCYAGHMPPSCWGGNMLTVDAYIGGRGRQLAFYQYPPVVEEVDFVFCEEK